MAITVYFLGQCNQKGFFSDGSKYPPLEGFTFLACEKSTWYYTVHTHTTCAHGIYIRRCQRYLLIMAAAEAAEETLHTYGISDDLEKCNGPACSTP